MVFFYDSFCKRWHISWYKINKYFNIVKGNYVRFNPCNHIIEKVYNQFFDFLCRQFAWIWGYVWNKFHLSDIQSWWSSFSFALSHSAFKLRDTSFENSASLINLSKHYSCGSSESLPVVNIYMGCEIYLLLIAHYLKCQCNVGN